MKKVLEGGSYRPELLHMMEPCKLLDCDSAEELDSALKWIAAMLKAKVSREVIADYIDRNIGDDRETAKR